MSAKKAKLNLDFGHGGISMNFAKAYDIQPRNGMECDWDAGTFSFNTEEFEEFPGSSQNKIDEVRIKTIAAIIKKAVSDWQVETGCDFDTVMEVTISASFFEVFSFPYSLNFAVLKDITEEDMKKIEDCKQPEKILQIPIPGEKIKSLTSPYFTLLTEKNIVSRVPDPRNRKTKSLGFNAYFIIKHPALTRLLEIMREDGDKINVYLSCEKSFNALASKREMEGKTALIHITDYMSEFSVWDNSELKYLNNKETGLRELREAVWRLCLCYHKNPSLMEQDFELTQSPECMQRFYNMVMNAEISDDSKELLSAYDCSDLLEYISCILENETEESIKYSRLNLPGKNKSNTGLTISNYVLCYFAREAIRNLLLGIKQIIYNDDFCRPEFVILECPLPLNGIEKLANEVFEIPVRRAIVKWDGEMRSDLSSAGVGALQNLIANNVAEKKKTAVFQTLFGKMFSKVS
ncbi:MAG: hypothetical protein LBU89_03905 [Fibromonadaceae bacterium]|jgi:hypothetical protein|nr:hypothetical protein [Fibromonadaceae bacterium]